MSYLLGKFLTYRHVQDMAVDSLASASPLEIKWNPQNKNQYTGREPVTSWKLSHQKLWTMSGLRASFHCTWHEKSSIWVFCGQTSHREGSYLWKHCPRVLGNNETPTWKTIQTLLVWQTSLWTLPKVSHAQFGPKEKNKTRQNERGPSRLSLLSKPLNGIVRNPKKVYKRKFKEAASIANNFPGSTEGGNKHNRTESSIPLSDIQSKRPRQTGKPVASTSAQPGA